jgi:hypothetical protein
MLQMKSISAVESKIVLFENASERQDRFVNFATGDLWPSTAAKVLLGAYHPDADSALLVRVGAFPGCPKSGKKCPKRTGYKS